MNIVFFTHPDFLGHQSMPRFARMLSDGMREREHTFEIWSPKPFFLKFPWPLKMRKWIGYIDQYIVFPLKVRKLIQSSPSHTLFVFTDHALGPWIHLVAHLPHVIHCHDFLAQLSAIGQIPEHKTSWSGRQYQALIRKGYLQGKNFISVSEKTRNDLHKFLNRTPLLSELVYNGLNQNFKPHIQHDARNSIGKIVGRDLKDGYLLHVGGNQWYKNRIGVIEIYDAFRAITASDLPLILIGEKPDEKLTQRKLQSPYKNDICFLLGLEDEYLSLAYSGASVFLFPSLAEGFGWPIAEAMASGCPVLTTGESPMTEVAGDAGFLIPRRPNNKLGGDIWAKEAAHIIYKIINMSPLQRKASIDTGLKNAESFNTQNALDRIEAIYKNILQEY